MKPQEEYFELCSYDYGSNKPWTCICDRIKRYLESQYDSTGTYYVTPGRKGKNKW